MTETPDFFTNRNGALEIKEARPQRSLNGQNERPDFSTNLSGGGTTSLHGGSLPKDKAGNAAQLFTNQKEGDASLRTLTASTISDAAPSVRPALVAAVDAPSVHSGNANQPAPLFPPNQGAPLISPSGEQLVRVRELMRDGKWRTLDEISEVTGDPPASVSARLRDLRKPRYGLWTVRRKRIGNLFYYQMGGKGI